jgi:phosphate transport system substrate-binding protein
MKIKLARTALLAAGWAWFSTAAAQPNIAVQTTDTLLGLNQKWADACTATRPDTKVQLSGGAIPAAFTALAERKVSLVTVPRAIRYKEAQACEAALGKRPVEFKVAVNGAVVYVPTNNAVAALTYDELEAIFRGKYRNWKQVGGKDAPIVAFGVATNAPAGELFSQEVLGGKPATNDVRILTPAELITAIAAEPNAIGFGPFTKTTEVRGLDLKRAYSSTPVAPSEDTIANRIYPITRFVFCYLSPDASPDLRAYVDWMRSDTGQQAAAQAGYFVLPAKWRSTP